ncbi:response regulator transcription factor [Vagococcus sp. BWB3-3]|uniref:Response regulator transcription factor n=1 Tax=Vagococcus allomyrinae TaxID=2794353 RepID=A0A940PEF6_9ENTE|nr:response regulator transcription factor [Vagococcus allomyrinae]MBP1043082.1 response regulator transcription factor [Vagococcus allomyrinae]
MSYNILLVEDEKEIRRAMTNFLRREDYHVVAVETGEEALREYTKTDFHLVLLDMMLPGIGGEEVLEWIRRKSDVPILIISALNDELIQLDAFEQSVDDYVVKPFSMNILVHKIASLLRRVYEKQKKEIIYHDLRLLVNNYEVYYQEQTIELTVKEFEILQTMLLNSGKVYSREELLTVVWGYDYFGDSRNIDVHIKNIRKKLPFDCIKTVKGIGYKVDRL